MNTHRLRARVARLEERASTAIGVNPVRDLVRLAELSCRRRRTSAQMFEYIQLLAHVERQEHDRNRARWEQLSQQDAARLTDDERAELDELQELFQADPSDS
jgi:hypothetical protein